MSITIGIALLFLCLLFSAFFSSSETAFTSLQKLRLKHLANKGESRAERVTRIMQRPTKVLTTILLGNNLFNTAAASLRTMITIKALDTTAQDGWAVVIATVSVTMFIGGGIARLIGGKPKDMALVSEGEIRTIINVGQEEGIVEKTEAYMMSKVFEFGDSHVREAMVPRPDIVWIEKGTTLAGFLDLYAEHPHSNFPVFDNSIDNVSGILSTKDVFLAHAKGELTPESEIATLIKQGHFVPESKHIGKLFGEMQAQGKEIAIVVDEFGGTDGLVTMKQLAEEVVGHFGDELARRHKTYETIGEHTFLLDAGMRLDQANEELGLSLPEGNYETVAGFVLSLLGHIPDEGEQTEYGELKLTITKMKGTKIDKVLITKANQAAPENQI